MSRLTPISFRETDLDLVATAEGRVVVTVTPDGKLDPAARRANRLTRGAVQRVVSDAGFAKVKNGQVISLAWPAGMAAESLDILVIERRTDAATARKAGVALAKVKGTKPMTIAAGSMTRIAELVQGLALRDYRFDTHKSP
jgi:leucyl aminopeptidase